MDIQTQYKKNSTPAVKILILHKLIYFAIDLKLYSDVKVYCTEIINEIALLERFVIESSYTK